MLLYISFTSTFALFLSSYECCDGSLQIIGNAKLLTSYYFSYFLLVLNKGFVTHILDVLYSLFRELLLHIILDSQYSTVVRLSYLGVVFIQVLYYIAYNIVCSPFFSKISHPNVTRLSNGTYKLSETHEFPLQSNYDTLFGLPS